MTSTTALVFSGPGAPLTMEALTLEDPHRGEVMVRLGASGICHSDLHVRDGDWSAPTPLVLGHEGAGVVEAVGDGVRDVVVGDHVVLSWMYPCRRCDHCVTGRAWACTGTRSDEYLLEDGTTRLRRADGSVVYPRLAVGTFATHTVVPESAAVKIPDAVPFDVASLIGCAITTGVGAVWNTARVPAGASAVVIGCGGVGLAVIMGLASAGAHPIIAVDLEEERLDQARDVGATRAVQDLGTLPDGEFDYVFEAIGTVPTIERVPELLKPGGVGVLVGLTAEGQRASFDIVSFTEAGKTLVGSNYGGSVSAVDFPRIAQLYLAGRLPLDQMISHRIRLDEVDDAFDAMRRRERLRSVIVHDA